MKEQSVDIKTNWEKFEQQGKADVKLQHEFDQLFTFYTKNLPVNIFVENSDNFTKEFKQPFVLIFLFLFIWIR